MSADTEMGTLGSLPVETINNLLKLAENADSLLASALPKVRSSDNGKVLTVVKGKWAAKQPE